MRAVPVCIHLLQHCLVAWLGGLLEVGCVHPAQLLGGCGAEDVLARLRVLLPAAARDTLLESKVGSHKGRALVKPWRVSKSHCSSCQLNAKADATHAQTCPDTWRSMEMGSPEGRAAACAVVSTWWAASLLHPKAQEYSLPVSNGMQRTKPERGSMLPNSLTLLKPSTPVAGQAHPGEYPCCATPDAEKCGWQGKGLPRVTQRGGVSTAKRRCGHGDLWPCHPEGMEITHRLRDPLARWVRLLSFPGHSIPAVPLQADSQDCRYHPRLPSNRGELCSCSWHSRLAGFWHPRSEILGLGKGGGRRGGTIMGSGLELQ